MNLSKCYEFFQPEKCKGRIHIIGCGAIGSTVAEFLVRFGLTKITLYDFDVVEAKNIANQMYREVDIGKLKVDALAEMLTSINSELKDNLRIERGGYTGQKLSGYVFLCVDNIDLRREIATANKSNRFIRGMFDFRMGLTEAQHYAADWNNVEMVENFLNSMQFSHEEAAAETPISACNQTLSICTTVRSIVAHGVDNFVNFVKDGSMKKMILTGTHCVDAF